MFVQVFLCVLVAILMPISSTQSNQETYECGAHGKFEYCIDGIPGCVIGCHCHPGYYFDTATKICEPNAKLTRGFRRQFIAEPTRVTYPAPTRTITDNFDEKVDEIAKDTDDLGDWLYNQFFKTIENQVINNTETKPKEKEIEKDKPLTRRSSRVSESVIDKYLTKRKTRKSMKSSKKKKHTKVHGLRRKLLRITEDDSLFDSESDSDSSNSDSDSDSDSDSGSSSDSSSDSSDDKSKKKHDKDDKEDKDDKSDKDDKDHGHKKVIIFNKRPKPPLPSFIFLPSMDTPFYPPIGLPPPPAYPMYPMIPVPPMPPMFPPFPGTPKCDEAESNATTDYTTTEQAETATEPSADLTTPEDVPETTLEDTPSLLKRRSRLEKELGRKLTVEEFARASDSGKPSKSHSKMNQRKKLMQKLRDRMMAKRLNNGPPMTTPQMEQEIPLIDQVPISQEAYNNMPSHAMPPKIPKLEDVDFKYLSELIHRVNQSDARNKLASLPFDLNEDLKELQKIQSQQSRRNFNPYKVEPVYTETNSENNHHRKLRREGSPDDAYYTNLGRQIASMIRNADSKVDQQISAELDQTDHPLQFHPVLNENYEPRSYWERSVRSPLTEIGNYHYLDKSRTLRHSHEKSLLNLENEVELFASTTSPLSLEDLENILNTMKKAHVHIKYTNPLKFTKHSNYSLNVSLLPKYVRPDIKYRRVFKSPETVEYAAPYVPPPYVQPPYVPRPYVSTPYVPPPYVSTPYVPPSYVSTPYVPPPFVQPSNKSIESNSTNTTVTHNTNNQSQKSNIGVPLTDYWMYNSQNLRLMPPTQQGKPALYEKPVHYLNPTQSPFAFDAVPNNNRAKKPRVEYLQFIKSIPVMKLAPTRRPEPKLLSNPSVANYKNLHYFSGNKHHYMFEEASYPLQISFKRIFSKPLGKSNPSYFHHELHHFDYFD